MDKKTRALYGISAVLGLFLIWWGYENLFPIERMENRLVEEHLSNWYLAPIFARVFIALNFVYGAFLLLNINPRKHTPKFVLGMFILGIYDLIWELTTSEHIISSTYTRYFNTNLYISLLFAIGSVLVSILLIKYGSARDIKFKWMKYVLGVSLFSLPFILNPVYPADLMNQSAEVENTFDLSAFNGLPEEYRAKERALLTLYSTNCPYCLNAMQRLAISKKQSTEYIPVFIGFIGSEEGIDNFFSIGRCEFDYSILEVEQFYQLSGSTYPTFILLENGKATSRWNGMTFNYHTLQEFVD